MTTKIDHKAIADLEEGISRRTPIDWMQVVQAFDDNPELEKKALALAACAVAGQGVRRICERVKVRALRGAKSRREAEWDLTQKWAKEDQFFELHPLVKEALRRQALARLEKRYCPQESDEQLVSCFE